MDLLPTRPGFLFESLVMLFQLIGFSSLIFSRLIPPGRWSKHGKTVFIVALVGLGIAGAICSHHRSSMGLFAGGTMTFLLVGMIAGTHPAVPTASVDGIEPTIAA